MIFGANVKYGQLIYLFDKINQMQVPTGAILAIQSRSNGRYLNGRAGSGDIVTTTNKDPHGDKSLNWFITQIQHGIYIVQSLSSKGFLNGRSHADQNALVTNYYPGSELSLHWRIFHTLEEDWFVFESVSSKCFLDGRNHQEDVVVTNRNWRDDKVFYFRFINI